MLEVSPGDCGSGGRLLTGVNNQAIPGKKRTTTRLSAPRQALDDPAPSPPSPPSASSSFGRCCRRTCRISARPPQTRRTAERSSGRSGRRATTAGVTMLLLAPGGRKCLHRCCAWTLGCQLLLWILCAVKAEERSFNVEVNLPSLPLQPLFSVCSPSLRRGSPDAPEADGRVPCWSSGDNRLFVGGSAGHFHRLSRFGNLSQESLGGMCPLS